MEEAAIAFEEAKQGWTMTILNIDPVSSEALPKFSVLCKQWEYLTQLQEGKEASPLHHPKWEGWVWWFCIWVCGDIFGVHLTLHGPSPPPAISRWRLILSKGLILSVTFHSCQCSLFRVFTFCFAIWNFYGLYTHRQKKTKVASLSKVPPASGCSWQA